MGRKDRLWLCISPILLCLVDQGLTLGGQPEAYWAGDYTKANEGNPVLRWCLQQHPAASAAYDLAWIALFGFFIVVLPWQIAKTISLGVALGHIVGSGTWMWWRYELYWLFPVMLLSSAALIVWTGERASRLHDCKSASEPTATPAHGSG